ncbi:hypothetical protein HMPREF0063_11938 [Aeromicrobium marinum DSM 15272]|uniref:Uncharacterized protein n=1 Tax=Aeromicrobium marinum DSM 15272 TaxID=585531 RepID=E2SE02_9ACTN|nr:hypothetical protein [Aeromicrobium marinum]EFQ82729.1 hypothetical protein HMPREF0063_11938 [Aeromicrobium marinum DSM 15272]
MTEIYTCPLCGCPIQRLHGGTLADGVAAHTQTVHPDQPTPRA